MLQIPTITQEDLNAFRARIFGLRASPTHLVPTRENIFSDGPREYVDQETENELGYYADGAKRTLTDAQIAMFRHSEIYAILRERHVREENIEADREASLKGSGDNFERGWSPSRSIGKELSGLEVAANHDAEGLSARASAVSKRRKQNTDAGDSYGGTHTSRKVIRELDSIMTEEQILDYGDEPSSTVEHHYIELKIPPKTTSSQGQNTAQSPGRGGKKIWWPVLGT